MSATGTKLLVHKGYQVASNVILSTKGYLYSSALNGETPTFDGLVIFTIGAAVYFFCPPVGQTMFGLGYASSIFFFAISGLGGAT